MVYFQHFNIVAKDWYKIAKFYEAVFDCEIAPPDPATSEIPGFCRIVQDPIPHVDYYGESVGRVVGVPGAHIEGIHIFLPNQGNPLVRTEIEIFSYDKPGESAPSASNAFGFTHVCFAVDDQQAVLKKLLEHGGSLVSIPNKDGKLPGLIYAADPEGNRIELSPHF